MEDAYLVAVSILDFLSGTIPDKWGHLATLPTSNPATVNNMLTITITNDKGVYMWE